MHNYELQLTVKSKTDLSNTKLVKLVKAIIDVGLNDAGESAWLEELEATAAGREAKPTTDAVLAANLHISAPRVLGRS